MSQVLAAALISVLGGMSVIGRLGLGVVGDRVGTLRLFKVARLVMGVSYLMWLAATDYSWLLVFAAVLGLGTRCADRAYARHSYRVVRP
jgi:predicted MFS family arabinose efflux permease